MLWHKGWLETRFRLSFALGLTSLIPIFQYSFRTAAQTSNGAKGASSDSSSISVPFTCSDCLRDARRSRNRHATLCPGDERSPRFDIVHYLAAGKSSPAAGGPSRSWMVGSVGGYGSSLCGMWLVSPSLRAIGTAPRCSNMRERSLPVLRRSISCRCCWLPSSTTNGGCGAR